MPFPAIMCVFNILINAVFYTADKLNVAFGTILRGTLEGHISLLDRANMNQFMERRNQIEFSVRFKTDRSLKYLQYDPYVYHVVYQ